MKIKQLTWFASAMALALVACDGDPGPAGPAGPPGEQGTPGEQGPPGDGTSNPSVSAVTPGAAFLERTVEVTIAGSGTEWESPTVDFGAGITVDDVTVASGTGLKVTLTVAADAAVGPRDVTVTEGESSVTYAGAFDVDAPLAVGDVLGTPAQGSILLASAAQRDVSTPFDPNNIAASLEGNSAGIPQNVTSYAMDMLLFVDVGAPTGAADVIVESGIPGTTVSSRSPEAVDVQARTPTAYAPGDAVTGTVASALESHLYELEVPANTQVTLEVASTDPNALPGFLVLPSSGSWDDLIGYVETIQLVAGANPATYYVVFWDDSGASGYDYDLTSAALSVVAETEPNDDSATATALTAPTAVSADIGTSGDNDWYSVTLASGETLTASVGGGLTDTCGSAGAIDSEIEILDTDGTTSLADNDDISLNNWCSATSHTATAAGTYFVRVAASVAYCDMCTFDYTLNIDVQ